MKPFLVVLLSVSLYLPGHCEDWHRWLGPMENGKTTEVLPTPVSLDKVAWQAEIGIGFSSFSIAQGRVFTMGHQNGNETVWCFSETDGKVQWKHTYPAKLMANLHEGGPNATPTIDGTQVFSMSKDGQLFCLSIDDGSVIWQKNMPEETEMYRPPEWGYGGSPYILGNQVIIESGVTVAYEKSTGKEIWRSKKYRPAYGSPTSFKVAKTTYLAILKTDGLVILDPKTGKTLAFYQWRTSFQTNANTPLIIGEGLIFLSTGYDRGCASFRFDGENLTKLYESDAMSNHMGNSVFLDGHLYGFDGTAHRGRPVEFCCIDASTGAKQWTTQEYKYGSVIAAGKDLIVLTETGEILVGKASPTGFQPKARHQLGKGRYWTPPALANGKIYTRNANGTMVVLRLD